MPSLHGLRNKNIAPSAEEMKLLKAFAVAPPATVGGYYPFLALVGGAPVGAVLEKLFESKDRARLRPKRVCTAFSLKPRPPPVHRRPSKMTGRAESQPG